jgi:hypothetical protein
MPSLTGLTLSDNHLGHRRTPTEFITKNIKTLLLDKDVKQDVQIIFWSGDLLDRSVNLSTDDAYEIISFLGWFLLYLKKNNIVSRFLEGTPSHEWKQTRILSALNQLVDVDVKWVSTLSIERHKELDITILYLPDEWSSDNEETWKQVQQLLLDENLTKVDYVVMHGQMEYQLPDHVTSKTHKLERYQSIAGKLCFCGHIHKHSIRDNFVVPGSTDRLAHGEEEAKGIVKWKTYDTGEREITFIENKNAKIYKTIDCSRLSVEEMLVKIDTELKDVPQDSFIRLEGHKDDPILSVLQQALSSYLGYNWSQPKIKDKTAKLTETLIDKRVLVKSVPITERTIADLVTAELQNRNVGELDIANCIGLLEPTSTG